VLAALWILVFSVTSQVMMVAPILPSIARELGVAEFHLATLVTAYSAAVAVVALCMGPVSDRVGRRRMLLVGGVLMTAGLALHGVPGGYGWLLAVRILTGAGGGVLTGATADKLLAELKPFLLAGMAELAALGAAVGCPIEESGEDRMAVTARLGAFKTSMLQDVEAGRAIELEALLGAPIELADRAGVDVPVLRALYAMTRLMAESRGLL
jgi:MFS family permease